MSNKKHRNQEDAEPKRSIFDHRALTLVGGALFVVLFIVLGIVIVTALGGDDLSKGDPKQPDLPALGALPDAPATDFTAFLADGSFEGMSDEQRATMKAAAEAMFANAHARASSQVVTGLDIARRDGRTRATRQYRVSDKNPGGTPALITTTVFYCDGPPGAIDIYRLDDSGFEQVDTYDRKSEDSPPFQRIFSGADWSTPVDLGFRDVQNVQVHGVQLIYKPQETVEGVGAEYWFEVSTGRLIYFRTLQVDPLNGYYFDWRKPPTITVPEKLNTPPCAGEVTGE